MGKLSVASAWARWLESNGRKKTDLEKLMDKMGEITSETPDEELTDGEKAASDAADKDHAVFRFADKAEECCGGTCKFDNEAPRDQKAF